MITLDQAFMDFLRARRADGLRASTVNWYRSRVGALVAHFGPVRLQSVTVNQVRSYVISLRGRRARYVGASQRREVSGGLSLDTVQGHMRALRAFFKWCAGEYALDGWSNPMLRIKMPKLSRDVPKAASLADLPKLLDACGGGMAGFRDRAMLLFLADTGCRAGGLLSLRLSDLDLAACSALVVEKFGKVRTLYFSQVTAGAIAFWLGVRPGGRSDFVFCSLSNGIRLGAALSLGGLHRALRRLKKRARVSGRVNPHAWRHAFGLGYLDRGGDPASLRRLMGHSDMSTTLTYYAVHSERELAEKHHQYSPVGGLEVGG